MGQVDVNAYATTAANAAAGAPTLAETQQPGGAGSLRQVVTLGDPLTRANMQTVKAASTAAAATDLPAIVALHPSSPTPAGDNTVGRVKITGSVVSTVNSTAVALAAAGVFTGTSEDVSQYASVTVQLISNVASATDGLSMQQSPDGTNWDNIDAYSIPAAIGKNFGIHVSANFFRVVYTNGATLQTSFRLQTIYHVISNAASSVRPQDARTNDNDMQEVIGYNALWNGVTWDRVRNVTSANGGSGIGVQGAGILAQYNATLPTLTSGVYNVAQLDVNGRLILGTSTANIGSVISNAPAATATYTASVSNLASAALATDIFTLTGSATKTISIRKIAVNGVQTTGAQVSIIMLKRSTANTAGTSTATTAVPMDSANVAATGTALAYTANPTVGTLVGNVHSDRVFVPGAATTSDAQGLFFAFGDIGQQPIVLRGIAQVFAINLAGATITGGSLNVNIEWQEA